MEKLDYEIRKKFVKDTNLPIQVLESPYFEYFLDLYEPTLGSKTSWIFLQREISDSFEGKYGKLLDHCRNTIDTILSDILESPGYKKFNEDQDLDKILKETPGEMKNNLYSGSNIGKKFLSIDLSRANFQALRWYDPEIVLEEPTWEKFLGHYTSSPSFIGSKNLRQVILGKTNPSRLIRVEKYLVWKIEESISSLLPNEFSLFSRMTDEIIWEIPKDYILTKDFEDILIKTIEDPLGIRVKINPFKLDMIQEFTHSGSSITGFIKTYDNGKSELKDVSKIYYPQIYKAWKELDLNPTYDLVFQYEGEIARFDYSLSFVKNETKSNLG